jgi:hypothetical protein
MTNAGDISLKAYMGKKITIAFKYVSSNNQAGTWQLKNFVVKERKPVSLPYSETFAISKGRFVAMNVSGSQTWSINSNGYALMTGYVGGGNNANEDWLISPQIDLTLVSAAKLTFDHAARYFSNLKTDATVWVSQDYEEGLPTAATWTQLPTVPFTDPGSWTFVNSREISLTTYAGKKITIAFKYLSTSAKAGTWEIKNFKVQEGEAFIEDFGKGTEAVPYNVAGGIIYQGTSSWLKGYIVGYATAGTSATIYTFTADTCTQTANILIADSKTETNPSKCIAVQLPIGAVRTGLNLKDSTKNIGKQVALYGSLEAYFGKPGFKNTSYYVFLESGKTGGIKPFDYSKALLYESFASGLGIFSQYSVKGDQIWGWSSTYKCALASGYASSTRFINEDWLISPKFSLAGVTTATLIFTHAGNYFNNTEATNCTLFISTNYESGDPNLATWTQLTIPTYDKSNKFVFTSSGDISLTPYVGSANVKIAFKYLSDGTATGTGNWEIKDVLVK